MPKSRDHDLLTVLYLAAGALRDDDDLKSLLALSVELEDPTDRRELVARATRQMARVA